MNYYDGILENKAFKFVKQLLYNIAVSICIILAFCLLFVYGFKFKPYNVLTGSMEPAIGVDDLVIVHSSKEYKVGDVLKFDQTGDNKLPTVHRLIGIKEGYYICHGDNTNYSYSVNKDWHEEADAIKDMSYEELRAGSNNYQYVTANQIEGKVVGTLTNYGKYIDFIGKHKVLFITMIVGLWCITMVFQNEIEMSKARRFA